MPDKHKVSWMSMNHATIRADDVDHAIVAAMKAGMEGNMETNAHPTMQVENMRTGKITVVTIDSDYKVVKTHELDVSGETDELDGSGETNGI